MSRTFVVQDSDNEGKDRQQKQSPRALLANEESQLFLQRNEKDDSVYEEKRDFIEFKSIKKKSIFKRFNLFQNVG